MAILTKQDNITIKEFGQKNIDVLFLIIWPWLLIAVNPTWIFQNSINYGDAWIYFGYFLNIPEHASYLGNDGSIWYYGSRLTWILPGYLLYRLLPALIANLSLHLLLFYTSIFSVYGTMKLLYDKRVGLFTSMCLGSYSYFLLSIGWDYVDAGGITYCCLLIYLITHSSFEIHQRWRLLQTVFIGVISAALIYTNISWIIQTPAFCVYYLLVRGRQRLWLLLGEVAAILFGVGILTLFLCFVNVSFGGNFWFYKPSIEFVIWQSKQVVNLWKVTTNDWSIRYTFLIWPIITITTIGTYFVTSARRKMLYRDMRRNPLLIFYSLVCLITLYLQSRANSPILQFVYYVSYLIPGTILALGSLCAPQIRRVSASQFTLITSIASLLGIISLGFRSCGQMVYEYPNISIFLIAIIWIVGIIRFQHHTWPILLFTVLFFILTPSAFSNYNPENYCNMKHKSMAKPQDSYLAVIQSNEILKRHNIGYDSYVWADENETIVYHGITFTRLLWPNSRWNFPSLKGAFRELDPADMDKRKIILLTKNLENIDIAQKVLQDQHVRTEIIVQEEVHQGTEQFYIIIFAANVR